MREGASRLEAALDASFAGGCSGSSDNPASGHSSAPPLPDSCGMWVRPSAWLTRTSPLAYLSLPLRPSSSVPSGMLSEPLLCPNSPTWPHPAPWPQPHAPPWAPSDCLSVPALLVVYSHCTGFPESLPSWITWFSLLPAFVAPRPRPLSPASSLKLYSWTDRGRKYYLWASGRTLKEFMW